MKKTTLLFALSLLAILAITISCKHDNTDPDFRKNYAWACGFHDSTGYAIIMFSSDGGETWTRQGLGQSSLIGYDLNDIKAVDTNTVWATGSDNSIFKTSNGGKTWTRAILPALTFNSVLFSISIINKINLWISGSNGLIYHSTDNGNTWSMSDTTFFRNKMLQGIWAINEKEVYVTGGNTQGAEVTGFIARTSDGGQSWDSIVPNDNYNRNEWIGITSSGSTIVVYGGKSHYIVSFDGGSTWKNDSLPMLGGGDMPPDINHLIMPDPNTWWGALDESKIILTTDGGVNWTNQPTGVGGSFMTGLATWDNQNALAIGIPLSFPLRSPLIKTADGGLSWRLITNFKGQMRKVTCIKN